MGMVKRKSSSSQGSNHNKNNTKNPIARVLILVGKPFYLIIQGAILAFLIAVSSFGGLAKQFRLSLLKLKLRGAFFFRKKPQKKKKKKSPHRKRKHLKSVLFVLIILFIVPIIGASIIWKIFLQDLPSPQELIKRDIQVSTKIYDRNGTLLYKIYKDENRSPVPLDLIPLHVQQATLAIEDAEFYQHPGFSLRGISRAIVHNYRNEGELTGGSTITQQLVKNTLLSPEKTFTRKLREIVLAFQVEWNFNKHQILEMYLNEVSYGGTAYGIQEAAKYYFTKDVQDLTLGEAALLAGLPKSPTQYSPFGPNPNYAFGRQKEVLNLMEVNGYISREEKEKAEQEFIMFAPNITDIKAPHFVMYVREILENELGKELVDKGGLEVKTSVDIPTQRMVEQIVKEEVEKLASLNVGNGSAIVLNSETGEILAMAGSTDYFDIEKDGNVNLTTRPRQPGSSIKLVNYAYALENGMTAATVVPDTPVSFPVEGQDPYNPKNYDGQFRGNLTLRDAFAQSRNVPAVKVLDSYGVEKMLDKGKKMGITTWNDPGGYGLSLTLGGGEVKLIELAQVYATIANGGKRPNLTPIISITNYMGNTIPLETCRGESESVEANKAGSNKSLPEADAATENVNCQSQVVDPRVAFILTDILTDNRARTPVFGANSQLVIPGHPEVAVKTGTSNDLKDNLTVGYTKDYVVAVWVGNNDNTPMSRIASGVTGATVIFNRIMSELLASKESYNWEEPEGLVRLPICPWTGTLACDGCPVVQEYFLEENKPTRACSADWFKNEENGNESSAPEGQLLPEAASTESVD